MISGPVWHELARRLLLKPEVGPDLLTRAIVFDADRLLLFIRMGNDVCRRTMSCRYYKNARIHLGLRVSLLPQTRAPEHSLGAA
jgi:hypothetical protein